MKSSKNRNQDSVAKLVTDRGTVDVLYQKMGDRWFAFSLVDDEIFVGSISQEVIDEAERKARGLRNSEMSSN